jgi:hypothetical protein
MKQLTRLMLIATIIGGFSACGDKKDSAEREQEAQRAIQEGMQKEKAMMEGMQKGVENMEKKMTAQKEETKK